MNTYSLKDRDPQCDGPQVAFSLLLCVFCLEGPSLDPHASAQSKRLVFNFLMLPSEAGSFLQEFGEHVLYAGHRKPMEKSKSSLNTTTNLNMYLFCFMAMFPAPFCTPHGASLRASKASQAC